MYKLYSSDINNVKTCDSLNSLVKEKIPEEKIFFWYFIFL